jgi:hypothetical protein
MPISNIVDKRSNIFNVNIMAVFEDSWHYNCVENATQFDDSIDNITYIGIKQTTIEKAIKYASINWINPVTLYIYDIGTNNYCDYDHIDDDGQIVKLVNLN